MVCPASALHREAWSSILRSRRFSWILRRDSDHEFGRGTFRVRGDIVEVFPSYDELGLRIGLFGDEVDELVSFDPLTGKEVRRHERVTVYPKSHFVTPKARRFEAIKSIKAELTERVAQLEQAGRVLE